MSVSMVARRATFQIEAPFLQIQVSSGPALNPQWYRLDPVTFAPSIGGVPPDLSRVDAIGVTDLAPGGEHGGGSANISTLEVYATPSRRRERVSQRAVEAI